MTGLEVLSGAGELLNNPDYVKGLQELMYAHILEKLFAKEHPQHTPDDQFDDVISDMKMKFCKRMADKKEPLTKNEVVWVSRIAGSPVGGESPFDWGDDEDVTDEQLEGYATYLRNYLYTYKDEAQDIDPNIDPNEEHIGPMAQDIEQVAPDCVKETPEGVKTVDGNRLSLVNAGIIGELARRVLELEEKINGRHTD